MKTLLLVLLLVLMVPLAACASIGPKTARAGNASSPTGGIAILYDERNPPEMRYRRFELKADGTLSVGGGTAARDGKTEWSSTLSSADLTAILDAASAAHLSEGAPECQPRLVDGKESIRTTIEYATPSAMHAFKLDGWCPTLKPLRDAFEHAALARFQQQLDALPEPGEQRKRDRPVE